MIQGGNKKGKVSAATGYPHKGTVSMIFFLHKYINMYSKYMSQLDTIHCDQVPYHLTNSSTQHSGGEKKILGSYKYQQIL